MRRRVLGRPVPGRSRGERGRGDQNDQNGCQQDPHHREQEERDLQHHQVSEAERGRDQKAEQQNPVARREDVRGDLLVDGGGRAVPLGHLGQRRGRPALAEAAGEVARAGQGARGAEPVVAVGPGAVFPDQRIAVGAVQRLRARQGRIKGRRGRVDGRRLWRRGRGRGARRGLRGGGATLQRRARRGRVHRFRRRERPPDVGRGVERAITQDLGRRPHEVAPRLEHVGEAGGPVLVRVAPREVFVERGGGVVVAHEPPRVVLGGTRPHADHGPARQVVALPEGAHVVGLVRAVRVVRGVLLDGADVAQVVHAEEEAPRVARRQRINGKAGDARDDEAEDRQPEPARDYTK